MEKEFESGLQFYGVTTNHDNYKGVQGAGAMQPIIHPSTYKQPTGTYCSGILNMLHLAVEIPTRFEFQMLNVAPNCEL